MALLKSKEDKENERLIKEEEKANQSYRMYVEPYLAPRDGNKHVIMINSFSKMGNELLGCETKYTKEINRMVTMIQKAGYEIIDIKFNSLQGQGLTGQREGFHTLIIYK